MRLSRPFVGDPPPPGPALMDPGLPPAVERTWRAMLTIFGRKNRFCDGVSRRSFLRIGALGVGAGALTLADVFRAEARAGTSGSRHKAVINIFLGGAPPPQDMWEIKTEAPAEIRGEFKPIPTNVNGIQICEVFPRIAARMDRCVVIRSVVGATGGVDAMTERALGVLTSSRLVEALDLSRESAKVRARYGDGRPYRYQYDGAPTVNDQLLMARRLVEVGVRCVTLSYGRWDSHGKNFDLVRDHGSKLDQGFSALLDDLDARGLLDDVTVITWGEFGRTPRVNPGGGRDHWPKVSCALLAGGGMRTGQAIGSTNRLGEYANNRP